MNGFSFNPNNPIHPTNPGSETKKALLRSAFFSRRMDLMFCIYINIGCSVICYTK